MNLKRIAISGGTIVGTLALVAGVSGALFTDTDTIPGNSIAVGTVDITVHNFSGNKPINTDNMAPGDWTPDGRAEVYNVGTLPVKIYMHVANKSGGACPKTNLKLSTGHAGPNETERVIYNGSLNALNGAGNRVEVTGSPPFATLLANWSQVVHQEAQLDLSAGNAYQGTTCTWDEVFTAESL